MVRHGPEISKVMPALAGIFTNGVRPSRENLDPANSSTR
jgi:hypothetical protein